MRFVVILLVIAGLGGAYKWWSGQAADTQSAAPSQNGFVSVEMPDGATRTAVLVLSPPDCPSAEARRADALVQDLTQQGIPVVRGDSISFDIINPTDEQRAGVERAVAVFNQGAPAVFVNGFAMSNPTASQAAAEYRRTRL